MSDKQPPGGCTGGIPLIGYTDKLSVRPGETVAFKVSSQHARPYRAKLMRVICADPNPNGPGMIEEEVTGEGAAANGEYPSRVQKFYPGSYAEAKAQNLLPHDGDFSLLATILPTLPAGKQGILSCYSAAGDGVELHLDDARIAASFIRAGECIRVRCEAKLRARNWYRVFLVFDARSGKLQVGQRALPAPFASTRGDAVTAERAVQQAPAFGEVDRVFIAACQDAGAMQNHFNGKIESPMILPRVIAVEETATRLDAKQCIAHWDFSRDISSATVRDIAGGFHGQLHNLPTRAMTGADWNGSEMCWRHAPAHYAAIHFHADDIYDFAWQTDFTLTVPKRMRPGLYAMRIECADDYDAMPFFVCAPAAASAAASAAPPVAGKPKRRAKLCVLISTFTYAIYGNHARPEFAADWRARIDEWRAYPHNPALHRDYGLSTYNTHADGSGICYASHRRPLLNLRPGYRTFAGDTGEGSGLRHLQADTHLLAWLEQNDIAYDLITDQELQAEGADAIAGYAAVATASHPEYHTAKMLNALHQYRADGGNFLYLGGNGFYWKIAVLESAAGEVQALEVRRGEGGIRAWAAAAGEYYHSFDGEYGGLWRRNGRPPQQLAGVGFSAQGTFRGSYYRRRPDTFTDPSIAWIFAGIDDEIIGDFGFCGGGAAGFELDRADELLGSPPGLRVLASSENHADTFVLVPEEQLTHLTTLPGDAPHQLIRADMVYHPGDGDAGQLFAVGSITFCGSLLCNGGDNNTAKLLLNVLRGGGV